MSKRKVLIIGCGIGGPALALLLQRAGLEAAIYEAQPSADDTGGAFLNVASNGLAVLETLGLADTVVTAGFAIPRMLMWNAQGKQLGEVRNGALPGEGAPSVVVRRNQLQQLLRQEAERQGVPLFWGKRLSQVSQIANGQVLAQFSDGSSVQADALIGADGIHSAVRQLVAPDAPQPKYTGLLSCSGYAQLPELAPTPNTQHFIFGQRGFFGYFIKPGGEVWWFSNMAHPGAPRRSELAQIPNETWKQRLLALHQADQPFINQMIQATQSEIAVYPIYDLPKIPRWHQGSLALIGDAAHATSPSAGQGASLALEDALVLAKCLRDLPDLTSAFSTYEALRRQRAERIVAFARQQGSSKAAATPIARWLRDQIMPLVLRHVVNRQALDWLYSYRIDWPTPMAQPLSQAVSAD